MVRRLSGSGGLFGGESTDDNLFSTDIVEVLLGISEGPIKGLVDGANSFYVGDTPLKNVDGGNNFDSFELAIRKGSELGEVIVSRTGGFASSTNVNTTLASNTPVVRQGLHPNIDFIDIRLVINRLMLSNDDGQFEHTGKIKVEYKLSAESAWNTIQTEQSNPPPDEKLGSDIDVFYGVGSSDQVSASPGDRTTFWQNDEPIATTETALWFDKNDGHKPYHLVNGDWVTFVGQTYASGAWTWNEESAWGLDKQTKAYVKAAPAPTTREQGDYWLNTSDNQVYFFNGSTWIVAGSSLIPGRFGGNGTGGSITVEDGEIAITGKTTSPFVKEFRFPVTPSDDVYQIRITKTSPENTDEEFFDVAWESFQEVEAEPFNFPGLATAQLVARASDQFSSVPDFSGVYEGRVVKVPSNYDPDARTYSGVWDGTWTLAYTNNPAFIVNDLVENDRYGLNAYYPVVLNKWDVYDAGVWCDTLREDGQPRFTFNGLIADARGTREAIDYICGIFGGRYFDDGNGSATIKIDKDDTAVALFAPENVVGGNFTYSFTEISGRYNDINVAFVNPDLNWQEDHRRVYDADHIAAYGRIPLDFIAVGCTNEAEAIARARYKLITGISETALVNFKTNRLGLYLKPYEIILISDDDMNAGQSGRVKAVTGSSSFSLRDPITLEPGFDYKVLFHLVVDGELTVVERSLPSGTSGTLTSITTTTSLPTLPDKALFVIQTTDGSSAPQPFRVTSITEAEGDPDRIEIQAVKVNRSKWAFIDGEATVAEVIESDARTDVRVLPVQALRVQTTTSTVGTRLAYNILLDWDPSLTPTTQRYRVYMSKDNGPAALLGETSGLNFLLSDILPGEYLFDIVAVGANGRESAARRIEHRLVGDWRDVPVITNLRLLDELGSDIFESRSPMFVWDPILAPEHKDYRVQILTTGGAVLRTSYTADPSFRYEYTDNAIDSGSAIRNFKVSVRARDQFGYLSEATELTVNNPAPAVPTAQSVVQNNSTAVVSISFSEIRDFVGVRIHRSTTNGFVPSEGNLVYEGPNTNVTIPITQGDTYYWKVAVYDVFGISGLNYGDQMTLVSTLQDQDLTERLQWLGTNVRQLKDELAETALRILDSGISTQQALMQQVQTWTVKIDDADTGITAQAEALDALTLYVTNELEAYADDIEAIETSVGDISAGALIRMTSMASPGGGWARVGIQARASTGATWTAASLFLDAKSTGESRAVLSADNVLVEDELGNVAALFEAGTTYLSNARIHNLTADNITTKSLDADEVMIDGTLITDLIAANAVTKSIVSFDPGETLFEDPASGTTNPFTVRTAQLLGTDLGEVDLQLRFVNRREYDGSIDTNRYHKIQLYRNGTLIHTSIQKVDDDWEEQHVFSVAFLDSTPGSNPTYSFTTRPSSWDGVNNNWRPFNDGSTYIREPYLSARSFKR